MKLKQLSCWKCGKMCNSNSPNQKYCGNLLKKEGCCYVVCLERDRKRNKKRRQNTEFKKLEKEYNKNWRKKHPNYQKNWRKKRSNYSFN